jgi:hypothetical protein
LALTSISAGVMNSFYDYHNNQALGYYFFRDLPRAIIHDPIFREMLDLGDVARLEVAAAVHSLRESQVRLACEALVLISY